MTRSPRRLLSSFLVTTIGGLIVVSGLTLLATDRIIAAFALEDGEVHNKMMARAVSNALAPELRAWLAEANMNSPTPPRQASGYAALERGVAQVTQDLPTLKVELYRPNGTVIFSTGPETLGGREGPENKAFWQAVDGEAFSTVEFGEDFVAADGTPFFHDAVASYLPIVHDGTVIGIFEIYSDYGLVLALANDYFPLVAALVLGACLILYLTVLLFVWRAQRSLSAARDELAAARSRADAANRAKSRFLANMSHEFRTPLNAILGFSEVLAQERFGPIGTPKYREYADDILLSGHHLRSLIDDVLDMAKIEAGTVQAEPQRFDLSSVVADVGRIIQGRTGAAGQRFLVELPDAPVWIESDPRLLRQVLLNLLSNATKFTPAGGELRLTLSHLGDHVRLSVADTGIGMSDEELATARQPFGQTERGKVHGHAGTGLGLPICNSLVALLAGNLVIDSSPQHGTQVHVVLPAAALATDQGHPADADPQRLEPAAAGQASAA